jgi:hypothetical protein
MPKLRSFFIPVLAGIAAALALTQPPQDAQAQAPAAVVDPCATLVAFVPPSVEDFAKGAAYSVFAIVLLVELARYLAPALRRRKGTPLSDHARIAIVCIAVAFGEVCGFSGVAPAAQPGAVGQAVAGIVVSALAVLFNETIIAFIRAQVRQRAGAGAVEEDEEPAK